jgi:hypothetical protein
VVVLAVVGVEAAASRARPRPPGLAEQGLEEIAVVAPCSPGSGTAELETRAEVGGRTKVLAGPGSRSELIISRALFGTAQHLVRLADFLEAGFGVGLLADVGMELARELAIGLLDLRLGRVARDAHDLVIVLEFHRAPVLRIRKNTMRTSQWVESSHGATL